MCWFEVFGTNSINNTIIVQYYVAYKATISPISITIDILNELLVSLSPVVRTTTDQLHISRISFMHMFY